MQNNKKTGGLGLGIGLGVNRVRDRDRVRAGGERVILFEKHPLPPPKKSGKSTSWKKTKNYNCTIYADPESNAHLKVKLFFDLRSAE